MSTSDGFVNKRRDLLRRENPWIEFSVIHLLFNNTLLFYNSLISISPGSTRNFNGISCLRMHSKPNHQLPLHEAATIVQQNNNAVEICFNLNIQTCKQHQYLVLITEFSGPAII